MRAPLCLVKNPAALAEHTGFEPERMLTEVEKRRERSCEVMCGTRKGPTVRWPEFGSDHAGNSFPRVRWHSTIRDCGGAWTGTNSPGGHSGNLSSESGKSGMVAAGVCTARRNGLCRVDRLRTRKQSRSCWCATIPRRGQRTGSVHSVGTDCSSTRSRVAQRQQRQASLLGASIGRLSSRVVCRSITIAHGHACQLQIAANIRVVAATVFIAAATPSLRVHVHGSGARSVQSRFPSLAMSPSLAGSCNASFQVSGALQMVPRR